MTVITDVRAAGLRGATPAGGWAIELEPDDDIHTLIAVHTDDGRVGLGSAFTNSALVRASLDVLRPMLIGESVVEPERVSAKLAAHSFGWAGVDHSPTP
jgi:D-galactarolactone cycloisomerase